MFLTATFVFKETIVFNKECIYLGYGSHLRIQSVEGSNNREQSINGKSTSCQPTESSKQPQKISSEYYSDLYSR